MKFFSWCLCKVHSCPSICVPTQEQIFCMWAYSLGNCVISSWQRSFIWEMKIIQCGHITWTLVVSEQGLQALLLDFLIASLQQEWLALIFFHANKPGQHYLHQVFAAVLNFLIPDASEHFKTKPRHRAPVATVWLGFTWRLGTQQNQRSKDTHTEAASFYQQSCCLISINISRQLQQCRRNARLVLPLAC